MKKRSKCSSFSFDVVKQLLQQLQDALGLLVSLSQHCLSGLSQHILLGVLHHFLSHIGITDLAVGGLHVLGSYIQVVDGVLQTVLHCTQLSAYAGYGVDGAVGTVLDLIQSGQAQQSSVDSMLLYICSTSISITF